MAGKSDAKKHLRLRLRLMSGAEIALGPGKAELLELVEKTGSITRAARQLGMSYMRAWTLIRTMNRCFKEPVVIAARGGNAGGGAELTGLGKKALAAYHEMDAQCLQAAQPGLRKVQKLLRD